MPAQVLEEDVEVVYPDAVGGPPGEDNGEDEGGLGLETAAAAEGDDGLGGEAPLDADESEEGKKAKDEEGADVRNFPADEGRLVQGEVDQD